MVLAVALGFGGGAEILARGLAVVETVVQDNGDGDGFADTNETVHLLLDLQNTSGYHLTRATLHASSTSPALACLGNRTIVLGSMAPWEVRTVDLVLTVGDVDRATLGLDALGLLSAAVDLRVVSDQFSGDTSPPSVVLDLDLDVSGGAGPVVFSESFESGLGAFEIQNLDQGLHGPAADGYRCQYHDPDLPTSSNYGFVTQCYLGASPAHADSVHWSIDHPLAPSGGRAYTGNRSLYYGVDLGPPQGQTTPLGVLEAAKTSAPIYLGHDAPVVLSFKHQIGLNPVYGEFEEANDRAVVMVQLANAAGEPAGPWIKVHPFANAYDEHAEDAFFSSCTFDPVDDGSTEDDLFPGDPLQKHGPSSTCNPEWVFMALGSTEGPFDPAQLGAAEGPGLEGDLGPGTWVESRVDLSRFRGQRIRVRFLATSMSLNGTQETWEDAFQYNPVREDDGWWIDDVVLDGALTEPATLVPDPLPNDGLPGLDDDDGDAVIASCDNCGGEANADQADTDADGVGDACDVCPFDADPAQIDSDADGIGDACDRCTDGDSADPDDDGLPCAADNCPLDSNQAQPDTDADGFGDPCDTCPFDPANDADGDGTCAEADTCPTAFNDDPARGVRISGPSPAPGGDAGLGWYGEWIAPDSGHVVYRGDPDADGLTDLFAVGLSPLGPPQRLSPSGASFFFDAQLSFSGAHAVFEWYPTPGAPAALYSAPLAGGPAVLLAEPVSSFLLGAAGSVVFRDPAGDIHSVPVTGGAPVQLNDPLVTGGTILRYSVAPGGARVVYLADQDTDGVDEMYSVPVAGGTPVRLNPALPPGGDVLSDFQIDPSGATVVYRADQAVDGNIELWGVAIGGGPVVRLNGPLVAGGDVSSTSSSAVTRAISPDGSTVVYRADQAVDEVFELWSVPIGGGAAVRLNGPLVAGGDVGVHSSITSDSATVFYEADQDTNNVTELYGVPIHGGTAVRLNPALPPGERLRSHVPSPDGARVLLLTDRYYSVPAQGGAAVQIDGGLSLSVAPEFTPDGARVLLESGEVLYSVPSAGGALVQLSQPLPPGRAIPATWKTSPNSAVVAWLADANHAGEFELYSTSPAGGQVQQLSGPLVAGGSVNGFGFTPESTRVLYAADQVADELHEMFATDLVPDGDGDGTLSFCDCDDGDPGAHPGSAEVCDGVDNDCDGTSDEFACGTPPAVPAGQGGTTPMTVAKLDPSGSALSVSWDTTSCAGAAEHQILYGQGTQLPAVLGGTFDLSGGACTIGSPPYNWSPAPAVEDAGSFVWWLIVVRDVSGAEGSWGRSGDGSERQGPGPLGSSGECAVVSKNTTNTCGQ